MSIWTRIAELIASITHLDGLNSLFERLYGDPENSVTFTIAVIGLGAKMAKADGHVTPDEVAAFREVFHINQSDETPVARIYNLARQDVAGFDSYARQIKRIFRHKPETLINILEGLFHIAMADREYHPNENDMIHQIAQIFGVSEQDFIALRARFAPGASQSAYDILGVTPDMPIDDIRAVWRRAIRDAHPDILIAKGLPEEAINLATKRMATLNSAWEDIYNTTNNTG